MYIQLIGNLMELVHTITLLLLLVYTINTFKLDQTLCSTSTFST